MIKARVFLICYCFLCDVMQAQPVLKHGQLTVKGIQLTDQYGAAVSLHGMSLGWHNLWPRFYNKGAVHELATRWNCSVIRASMGIQLNDSGYLKAPERSEQLMRNVIDACIKENVYVIIDWHDHNLHEKEAIDFFSRMSAAYGNKPHIIYEVYNEPDYETWPEVKAYAEKVICAIRQNDPDNIILIGSPRWDQDIQLPAADPVKGFTNLMYTVHFYAGTHKQWLRDRTDAAILTGLPVFISECAGMEASGDGPIDQQEWDAYVKWMDSKGLSWVAWSVSDKKETCSVLMPAAKSKGHWKDAVVKAWGLVARRALTAYR